MDTTDLIIDIIQGIDDVNECKGSYTYEQGEYRVLIRWDNDNAYVADVTRNLWPWSLPSHINKGLLIAVVKEKVNEIRINKMESDREQEAARIENEQEKSINWSGSMAGY